MLGPRATGGAGASGKAGRIPSLDRAYGIFHLRPAAGKYDPVSARAAKPSAETCGAEDRAQVHIREARYPGKKPEASGRRCGDVRHDVAQPAAGHDSVLLFRDKRPAAA